MAHLDYYQYHATARGIRVLAVVIRVAQDRVHIWDRIVLSWLFPLFSPRRTG